MRDSVKQWQRGYRDALWNEICGFLDLTVDEFMAVQERLWQEQMQILPKCELGAKLLHGVRPKNLDEFREKVPLTTYDDYEPYLSEHREDALPAKVHKWICSSGSSGKMKWAPFTEKAWEVAVDNFFAVYLLASSSGRGQFKLNFGDVLFFGVAPPPYGSGACLLGVSETFGLRCVPSLEDVMSTADMAVRSQMGFQQALRTGLDGLVALPWVLVKVGEELGQRKGRRGSPKMLLNPAVGYRLIGAMIKSKLARRQILPRDVWQVKSLAVFGMETKAYENKIAHYWGQKPYEFYVNTELGGSFAHQTWTRNAMTPTPHVSLLELIPEEEWLRSRDDPSYKPRTVLMNEVQVGKTYEVVLTNFYGGIFTRYRPGDLVKIIALEDEEAGIQLPQMICIGRADKLINVGGFTRLDERTLWLALEDTGVQYESWMARSEAVEGRPALRIYVSTRGDTDSARLEERLHSKLKELDTSYGHLEEASGTKLLRVTILPWGVFEKYSAERIAQGADPGQMKEIHMQPRDEVIARVLELASQMGKEQ